MNIINPATGEIIGTLKSDSSASVEHKLASVREAQQSWVKTSVTERLRVINKFAETVKSNQEKLAQILTSETGKPIKQSRGEVAGSLNRVAHLNANAEKWLAEEKIVTEGGTLESICFEPLGVIGNISAWNFPYNVGYNVFLYALVAGNGVMYKPSEFAALTGLQFKSLLEASGLPHGLFEVVLGDGAVGQSLLELDLDGYFFTGSYKTGLYIAKSVAHKLVPVQLELGGKDPLYVMEDVPNVKVAAVNAAEGAFYNNGQSCCAVERIYVHEKVYDEFVQAFVEEVKGYTVGDPLDETTFIGPLTREAQIAVILDQVTQAVSLGAKVELGGYRVDQLGFYLQPTVLTGVDHRMDLMKEESFGPVIGIQKVASDKEALQLMNDTEYGLTGAVFSSNEARALKLLTQLDAGTVYWNCCDRVSPYVPWSGRKKSGLGATLSYMGIRAFTQPKAYHMRK